MIFIGPLFSWRGIRETDTSWGIMAPKLALVVIERALHHNQAEGRGRNMKTGKSTGHACSSVGVWTRSVHSCTLPSAEQNRTRDIKSLVLHKLTSSLAHFGQEKKYNSKRCVDYRHYGVFIRQTRLRRGNSPLILRSYRTQSMPPQRPLA